MTASAVGRDLITWSRQKRRICCVGWMISWSLRRSLRPRRRTRRRTESLRFAHFLGDFQNQIPCRGAAFEPSPAFQSRESGCVVVSVAERRLTPIIGVNRRSATENGYALVNPALKSRAKLTWSLRRPGRQLLHLFIKDHQSRGNERPIPQSLPRRLSLSTRVNRRCRD